jgi:ABC-type transporter Mla subunit MlaD
MKQDLETTFLHQPLRKLAVFPTGISAPFLGRAVDDLREATRDAADARDRVRGVVKDLRARADALEGEARKLRELADTLGEIENRVGDAVTGIQDARSNIDGATF